MLDEVYSDVRGKCMHDRCVNKSGGCHVPESAALLGPAFFYFAMVIIRGVSRVLLRLGGAPLPRGLLEVVGRGKKRIVY